MLPLFRSRLPVFLLAAAAGVALVGAFAPFGFWPLALLSPAVLMLLWLKTPPRWAFGIGYAFGLGFFGAGVSWIYHSIHEFGQAPFAFAALLTIVFVMIMALYPALLGWLQRAAPDCCRALRLLVIIPAAWIWLEWLRGWLFTGFPWLQLGYSQLLEKSATPFAAIAPMAGVLGIGYLLLLATALALAVFLLRGRQRWLSLLALVLLGGVLHGASQIRWTGKLGAPISVALVQGNIPQEYKWEPDWLIRTVERYSRLTGEQANADLILWPEVAMPGTLRLFGSYVLDPLARDLSEKGADLVTGILHEGDDGRVYNAVVKAGDYREIYLKRHLVPFGEFIPLRSWMPWLNRLVLVAEDNLYPGHKATLLHAAGQAIGSSICYEDAFGEEMADFLPEATLLINLSNDAWFGRTIAPAQHMQIAQMRALELGRPLLRATNTGVTAIVDADGRIVARAPVFATTALTGSVTGRSGYTPFARWRNTPLILLLTLLLLVGIGIKILKEKSR